MMIPYYQNNSVTLYHGDCLEILPTLEDKFGLLLTDPPYVMLNTKWDKEDVFFHLFDMVPELMADKCNLVFTGRGMTAYRWCVKCGESYPFQEELVWNKRCVGSPLNALPRVHEMCYIFGSRPLNKIKIPLSSRAPDAKCIFDTFRFICQGFKGKDKDAMLSYLKTGEVCYTDARKYEGGLSKSVSTPKLPRTISAMRGVVEGVRPQSILSVPSVHKHKLHPTQKPVKLWEILLQLASNTGDLVIDPFAGSGTTGVVCMEIGRRCVLVEKEERFAEIAAMRLQNTQPRLLLNETRLTHGVLI